jgi:hypothetical protein
MAVSGNLAVAAIACAVRGWTAVSLHAAARNTARFSCLWFIVALAAPGLIQLVRTLPSEASLLRAFVAAHLVHFAMVALLLATFDSANVVRNPPRAALFLIGGFAVVAGLGLLARPQSTKVMAAVRTLLVFVTFVIFFLAFARTTVKLLHGLSALLGVALILRLASRFSFYPAREKVTE